ncbi:hypothetical protein ACOME3_000598 [Neoechinorhynchus agilis]
MTKCDKAYFCNDHPDAELIEDYHAGDLICPLCGTVAGERVIDVSAEWRTFSSDADARDMSRVGDARNDLYDLDYNMTTSIGYSGHSGAVDRYGRQKYRRHRHLDSSMRTLLVRYREVKNLAELLNLPQIIVENAEGLLKRIKDEKTLRGRPQDAIVAACLYIACRQASAARTLKEICGVSSASKRDIGRCFKQILHSLEESVGVVKTEDYMARFCSRLHMNVEAQSLAAHFSQKAVELDLVSGRAPPTIAGACIYMAACACGLRRTVKDVSDVTGVADSTILQLYRLLLPRGREMYPANKTFPVQWYQLPPA